MKDTTQDVCATTKACELRKVMRGQAKRESFVYDGETVVPYGTRHIVVADGLEEIPAGAFVDRDDIESIHMSPSVRSIGDDAFADCPNLNEVELNYGLTKIGRGAFVRCTSLWKIIVPRTVVEIGEAAFYMCGLLWIVELNEGLLKIGERAFGRCCSLLSISVPGTVRVIEAEAFLECKALRGVRLNKGLEVIGRAAFANCCYLSGIEVPSTVVEIQRWAFGYCYLMKKVHLFNGLKIIGRYAFCGPTDVLVPETVEWMEDGAMAHVREDRKVVRILGETLYRWMLEAEGYPESKVEPKYCRINCGSDFVIPKVMSFLGGNPRLYLSNGWGEDYYDETDEETDSPNPYFIFGM